MYVHILTHCIRVCESEFFQLHCTFALTDHPRVLRPPAVPPPPSHVTVASQVKRVTGYAEQTSVSVSLRPPCPFPGMHDYRLRFERVDFLAGYRSTVRAAMLKPDEIRQLYSGKSSVFRVDFCMDW